LSQSLLSISNDLCIRNVIEMETLRKTIFTGWNFMRWLRLAMGLILAYQAFEMQSGLLGILAGLFIFQALADAACCGGGVCNTTPRKQHSNRTIDVEFEEVKGR